jgi:hypothetical protein
MAVSRNGLTIDAQSARGSFDVRVFDAVVVYPCWMTIVAKTILYGTESDSK